MTEQVLEPHAATLEQFLADGIPPAEERAAVEQCVRARPGLAVPLLLTALAQKHRLRHQLEDAKRALAEPPWRTAAFLRLTSNGGRALVASGSQRLSVVLGPDVNPGHLQCGQTVFLNASQNVLVEVARDAPRHGAVGEFSRFHGTTQGVIRTQTEDEIVVDLAAAILEREIGQGDLLLYDRENHVAFEKLEKRRDHLTLLVDLPLDVRIEDLGGLDGIFNELVSEVTLHLFHPELVRGYGLKPTKGVLLCGPPGTGKTSLVRALGEHLGRLMGVEVKAFLVRPGVHRSMWFGSSEQRVRDLFRAAVEAAHEPHRYVLLFFDDMDHLGSRDHRMAAELDARLLPCFLQEVDAIRTDRLLLVGATNREDLLDEALIRPGRFGRLFRVGRPTRGQAREIFHRQLGADLPVRGNGAPRAEAVATLVDDVLAGLYGANGEFSRLATLTFRDGSREPLAAPQLMSGAVIAAAVEQAKRRGCFRRMQGGPPEVDGEDLRMALSRELSAICGRLKPGPALQQVLDLPQDRDVVKVERCAVPPSEYLCPSRG